VVDGSLLGTAVWFNGLTLVGTQFGPPPQRATAPATPPPGRAMASATMTAYQTRDHRFVHLLFLGDADRDFADLCQHLGRQDLATDARFTSPACRSASRAELMAILDQIAALRSAGFVA
jgi:crotonobetainyl-CoA:carnitine CoA-transferase CaiB-like acyl-CoA transferase